jgi:hypothetical protein
VFLCFKTKKQKKHKNKGLSIESMKTILSPTTLPPPITHHSIIQLWNTLNKQVLTADGAFLGFAIAIFTFGAFD